MSSSSAATTAFFLKLLYSYILKTHTWNEKTK